MIHIIEVTGFGLSPAGKLMLMLATGKQVEITVDPSFLLQHIGFDLAKLDGVQLMLDRRSDGREFIINARRVTPSQAPHPVPVKVIHLPGDDYRLELRRAGKRP